MPRPGALGPHCPVTARRVRDLLATGERSFSFEFFPPKDDGGRAPRCGSALRELEPLRPTFVSVTYGAGGSTPRPHRRDHRADRPRDHDDADGAPDLRRATRATSCARSSARYADAGVRNVLALRGDPPGGPGTAVGADRRAASTYADELVALVRSLGDFCVGVAAFPEGHRDAADLDADVAVLRRKQDAGAEFAITEMVLRASDYFGLRRARPRAPGSTIPILPGIMPITNLAPDRPDGRALRPRRARRGGRARDPLRGRRRGASARRVSRSRPSCATSCSRGGAPGLHFYTLNRSQATREIYADLALPVA